MSISARDYFAAVALQGLLAEPDCAGKMHYSDCLTTDFTTVRGTLKGERIATAAYRLADAMLKVRNSNAAQQN